MDEPHDRAYDEAARGYTWKQTVSEMEKGTFLCSPRRLSAVVLRNDTDGAHLVGISVGAGAGAGGVFSQGQVIVWRCAAKMI